MTKNTHLITIDPQNDFCDKRGSLFVPGADSDMTRLADFVNKKKKRLNQIHATLDSHQTLHLAHPIMWTNGKGEHPNPFTIISVADVNQGVWRAYNPRWQTRLAKYVQDLATNGRYPLMIWPPHCLIGSWGHAMVPAVSDAFIDWEKSTFNRVDFVAKGSNLFSEHYSAVQADVPGPFRSKHETQYTAYRCSHEGG